MQQPAKPKFWRRKYLVKKGMQLRYMSIILFWILLVSLICTGIVYWTVRSSLINLPDMERHFPYILESINLNLSYGLLILLIIGAISSILVSHKIAGPLYRIERELKDVVAKGDLKWRAKLRKGDELIELTRAINQMIEGLKKMVVEDRFLVSEIESIVQPLALDIEKGEIPLEDVMEIKKKLSLMKDKLQSITAHYQI